jgi:hypothetical protein
MIIKVFYILHRLQHWQLLPTVISNFFVFPEKIFMKDDIVWMHCNKVYWPTVVTNVNEKSRKVYVKTVNSPRKRKAIKTDFSSLIDFEERERNRSLCKWLDYFSRYVSNDAKWLLVRSLYCLNFSLIFCSCDTYHLFMYTGKIILSQSGILFLYS